MSFLLKFLLRLILLMILLAGAVLLYARYIEPFHVITEEVTVTSPYVDSESNNLRILVFADTHFGDFYPPERFEDVLSKINREQPDMVFFLGDLIDHFSNYTKEHDVGEISRLLSEIQAPYGKFAIFGNHDYGGGAENVYEDIMGAGGFQVLVNESLILPDLGVRITGIDDVVIGYGDPNAAKDPETIKKETIGLFHIVLSHAPDVADEIADYNVDLVLAGHTHGRQVNLDYFDEKILPPYGKKYIRGSYPLESERNALLYVNAGIGMTQLPFRFLSPPELTVFTLRPQS